MKDLSIIRYSLRATQVDSTRLTADAHAGNIAKIYGFYNKTCNVRHHVGVPTGEPVMTWMVKVYEIKSMNKYCAYLNPSKRSL